MNYPHVPSRSPFRTRDSHKAINIAGNERWSLGIELEDMWHMKPVEHHLPTTQDDIFMQLLVSQALLDSNDFETLSFEQVEGLKKEQKDLQDLGTTLSRSIQIETHIMHVSISLGNISGSRDSVIALQQQKQSNASRLNELMQRYELVNTKAFDIQETLLKHNAAVLNRGNQAIPENDTRAEALDQLRAIVSKYEPSSESKDPLALLQSIDNQLALISSTSSFSNNHEQELLFTKLRQSVRLLDTMYTQLDTYTQKKKAFEIELGQYRLEYQILQQKANALPPPKNSMYNKKLGERTQNFQVNLDHQQGRIREYQNNKQTLIKAQKQLEAQVASLDQQIKDKSRLIDQRDVRITRLKEEIKNPSNRIQQMLEEREQMWNTQCRNLDKKLDTLMANYDMLTMNAAEFDTNRMRYNKTISQYSSTVLQLESDVINEKMARIGLSNNTTDLRKEFRQIKSDLEFTHSKRLHQQVQENLKLKSELNELLNQKNKDQIGHSIQVQTE